MSRLELDLTVAQTPDQLQQLLFEAFQFPGWYGFNWNAFRDLITDPEQSTLPAVLAVRGWEALATRLPEDAAYLRADLEDVVESRSGCRIEWMSAEPDAAPGRWGT